MLMLASAARASSLVLCNFLKPGLVPTARHVMCPPTETHLASLGCRCRPQSYVCPPPNES